MVRQHAVFIIHRLDSTHPHKLTNSTTQYTMDAIRKRNGHHTKSKSTPINATHTTGGIRSANRKTPTMPGKQQCPYRFKQILKGFIVMCLLLLLLRYVVMRYELELNSNVAFSSLKSSSGDKKYDKSNVGTSRDDDDPKAAASSIKIGVYPFVEVMTVNTETKDNSVTNEIEEDPFDSSKMIFYPIFDIQEHILQSFDEEIYKSKSIIQKIYNKKRMKFLSKQKATKNSKWKIRRQNHKNNKNDIFVDPQVMERYYNNTVMIMTRKSYKGGSVQDQINQDRAMVVLNPFLNSNDGMMIGIFDGHAQEGHIVAHVIQQTLPKILVQQLSPILFENSTIATTKNNTTTRNNEQLKRAITKSFTIADTNIPLEYGINAGCTTSLILQIDSYTIITANVGDSQSFIFQYNKSTKSTKIVYITRKHKPDDPIERKRIEGMGGKVSIPPVKEQIMNGQRIEISSRVEIPKTNIGPVSLAMSRSSKFCYTLDWFLFGFYIMNTNRFLLNIYIFVIEIQ